MENITETTSTAPRTARRLRSLHLPSTSTTATELGRRFNSLRRPPNTASTSSTSPTSNSGGNNNDSASANADTTVAQPLLPSQQQSITTTEKTKVHIKLVPNVGMTNRCFVFDVIDRKLESGGTALKLGRYSDRTVVSDRLSFKSKVVSRYHAEIWLSEEDGKIYIKDSGSSSGTFVNHVRLASANTESSKPHEILDGDLIQLGVDYKGGLEPMYRAVRMRLEVDRREWRESSSNTYNLAAFQQLKNQINNTKSKEDIQECCICLYCIAPFQALFIAPCSHIYHYRCLRPLLTQNYPGFSCPLCRTYSDLEASVAVEESEVMQMLGLGESVPASSSSENVVSTSSPVVASNNNTTSEEDDEEEDYENRPLKTSHHNREKTVLDEDNQESSSSIIHSSPLIRPSLFFQRQISSSDGGLSVTLVGSPPRYDAGVVGDTVTIGEVVGAGGMVRVMDNYTNAATS